MVMWLRLRALFCGCDCFMRGMLTGVGVMWLAIAILKLGGACR
jgi:hypothetical protein